MDFNLNWIYIGLSKVLLWWHSAWQSLFGPESYFAWVLAIVFLVITLRVILFPVFVKQIKSQRAMQALQPQMKALQEKHKNDKETLQKEMVELYRREKANPLMGCLPLFIQAPVFFGLFHVLRLIDPTSEKALTAMTTEYFWTEAQFHSAAAAKLFGAPLAAAFMSDDAKLAAMNAERLNVQIVAAILVLTMVATTYITQKQIISRGPKTTDPQQQMIQKFMLYVLPASLLVSGALFPIGVVIYWVTNNFISMGQQFWVLKKMPPPNVGAKDAAKEISPEVAKALAPKPGVKPVNPKKGPKAKPETTPEPTDAGSTDSAATDGAATDGAAPDAKPAAPGVNGRAGEPTGSGSGTSRRPQDTRNRKRKGGRR